MPGPHRPDARDFFVVPERTSVTQLSARSESVRAARADHPHVDVDTRLTARAFAVVLAGGRGARLKQLTQWRASSTRNTC